MPTFLKGECGRYSCFFVSQESMNLTLMYMCVLRVSGVFGLDVETMKHHVWIPHYRQSTGVQKHAAFLSDVGLHEVPTCLQFHRI